MIAQETEIAATIPSNYTRIIARELQLQASELHLILDGSGLTAEQVMQEDRCLTADQQIKILENSLRLSNDDTLALRVGKRLTPPTHGAMGFLASSSPNLLMALDALATYLSSRLSFAHGSIRIVDDWLEGRCDFSVALSDDILRSCFEAFVTIALDCAEFILGRPLDEAIVYFTHDKPDYSHQYADFFPGDIKFSSSISMVRIPLGVCKIPNTYANYENYMFAMRQCELVQAQLNSPINSYKYKVQKMMLEHPPGVLNEEEAAASLFMGKRTLARKLKSEGTSFRQLRDGILSKQAADYLRDSDMSVDAIAALLNYHDSASFRRAFKRWFQVPPDQYRRQLNTSS